VLIKTASLKTGIYGGGTYGGDFAGSLCRNNKNQNIGPSAVPEQ